MVCGTDGTRLGDFSVFALIATSPCLLLLLFLFRVVVLATSGTKMFTCVELAVLALCCASTVSAQDSVYQFTMGVTSPAPVPGKPFTLTWTGGQSDEAVYIVLNDYFPDTPNQNIIYTTTDILCKSVRQVY